MSKQRKAKLITLEGSEGAGKTTALNKICEILETRGLQYICVREPGGDSNAEKIREILLKSQHLHAKTELLLMFAARSELIENVIAPTLDKGVWVISDRYVDASYAYQGAGRQLGEKPVKWLDNYIVGDLQADFTFLMDIDPEIGLKRVVQRGQADRIEREDMAFFNRIAEAYRKKASYNPEKYAVIDASLPLIQVNESIVAALETFLDKNI